jgi:hypothetical protein
LFHAEEHYDGTPNEMASPGSCRIRFYHMYDVGVQQQVKKIDDKVLKTQEKARNG